MRRSSVTAAVLAALLPLAGRGKACGTSRRASIIWPFCSLAVSDVVKAPERAIAIKIAVSVVLAALANLAPRELNWRTDGVRVRPVALFWLRIGT